MSPVVSMPAGLDLVRASIQLRSGLRVHTASVADVVRLSYLRMQTGIATHIVTVNPEIDQTLLRNPDYARAVKNSDVRVCDGVGVQIAARMRGALVPPRTTGVALASALVEASTVNDWKVIVIGAREGVRQRFEERLTAEGVAVVPGSSEMIDDIVASAAALAPRIPERCIVLVALGVPKQELLIRELYQRVPHAAIYVGVGGAIDYLVGEAVYPPAFLRKLGLEWLFRLIMEPHRRLARQFTSLPLFAFRELAFAVATRLKLAEPVV
ncbi:WecB/TagA/CpsF family glycosyltransferase [Povalibacter sp.]|uniref:WecB/TagA/CpsF family glycosyltransferase n=1 Tax=Povalibacter sp. TaxID=1962978 RepID=UPI002F3E477C